MYIKIKLICGHVHGKLPQNTAGCIANFYQFTIIIINCCMLLKKFSMQGA
jgi:hypothetical protein